MLRGCFVVLCNYILIAGRHQWLDQSLVETESFIYGDIIQGDFIEHYHNLTLKGLFALSWISQHCPQVIHNF